MKPASPVLTSEYPERVFAENQPEYLDLPAIVTEEGQVVTRWSMSWRERLQVLWRGSIYLSVLTFNSALQPVMVSTDPPPLEIRSEDGV